MGASTGPTEGKLIPCTDSGEITALGEQTCKGTFWGMLWKRCVKGVKSSLDSYGSHIDH